MDAFFEGVSAHLAPGTLWRTHVHALARMALVCVEASACVRVHLSAIKERELRRRLRVREAHRVLREEAQYLRNREWRHHGHFVRTRVSVSFNGRICVREAIFFGRSRRYMALDGVFNRDISRTYITLDDVIISATTPTTQTPSSSGVVVSFPWMRRIHMGHFNDTKGLMYGLRELTHVGQEFLRGNDYFHTDGRQSNWRWQVRVIERM